MFKQVFLTKTLLIIELSFIFLLFLLPSKAFASTTVSFSLVILPPSPEVQAQIEERRLKKIAREELLFSKGGEEINRKDLENEKEEKESTNLATSSIDEIGLDIPLTNLIEVESTFQLNLTSVIEFDGASGPSP